VIGVITGVTFIGRRNQVKTGNWQTLAVIASIVLVLIWSDRIPYLLLQGGVLAPLFALVIYALAGGGGITGKLLSHPIAVRLGEASYALYLIHMPLSWYLTRALQIIGWPRIEAWTGLAAFVLIAVLFSLAIFSALEQPARKKLKAWYRESYPWGRFKLFSVLNPSG